MIDDPHGPLPEVDPRDLVRAKALASISNVLADIRGHYALTSAEFTWCLAAASVDWSSRILEVEKRHAREAARSGPPR